jgi:hypothetical protein
MPASSAAEGDAKSRAEIAQLQKLELEIAKLRKDLKGRSVIDALVALTPLLSIFISVAAFLFGIFSLAYSRIGSLPINETPI